MHRLYEEIETMKEFKNYLQYLLNELGQRAHQITDETSLEDIHKMMGEQKMLREITAKLNTLL